MVSVGSLRSRAKPSFGPRPALVRPTTNFNRIQCYRKPRNLVVMGASSPSKTAKEAVERGLDLFKTHKDATAALDEFLLAQRLSPSNDEMLAAIYNAACAYVELGRWQEAADSLEKAINQYDLKVSVALRDDDLKPLRDRREWNEMLEKVVGGVSNEGYAKLRAEASSPFRLARTFVFGGLTSGAALGSLVSVARLLGSLSGNESIQLEEAGKTFGINVACLAVLGLLFFREISQQQKGIDMATKEEELAMLQVKMPSKTSDKESTISAFRGLYRILVVAGSKGQVKKSMERARQFRQQLLARGIVVIPIILNETDVNERIESLKRDLMPDGGAASGKGFSKTPEENKKELPTTDGEEGSRWKLEPYDVEEWRKWIRNLGVDDQSATTEVYAQVQLDGNVRASGRGPPPWEKLMADIPELDSLQTRLTDGRGREVAK